MANFDVCHVLSDFFDDTAELVAKGEGSLLFGDGMRCNWNDIGSILVFVEVCYCQIRGHHGVYRLGSIPVPQIPTYAGFTLSRSSQIPIVWYLHHWLTLTWPFPHFGISMFSSLISFWPWNLTAFIMMLLSIQFFDVAVLGRKC